MNNFLKSISLRKLLYSNRFTVPFSICIAFILWLLITINQKPTMDRTFTDIPVSINLENTLVAENEMSIIGDISQQKFTVVVRGPSYIVSSLTSADFSLYASAAAVDAPGEYNLDVAAPSSLANVEYEILSISPPAVNVNFDYIDTKEFTIEALAVGATAEEGLIAETGIVGGTETDTVTIKGPRTVVNKIARVVASAEVNKTLSSSETFDASIILYDEEGKVIKPDNLSLSTTNVKVTVPISKKKTVPVVVAFSNMPSGFDKATVSYKIDHPTVTVIGTPETVDKTKEVSLSPIDISSVSTSAGSFDAAAKLPEGVRLLDSIDHFTVTFNTADYAEKNINVTSVKFKGLSSSLKASGVSTIKNVRVCAPKSVLSKISSANVTAEIDLTDKKAGEHTVNVTFKIANHNSVWIVGTYKTTVTIK